MSALDDDQPPWARPRHPPSTFAQLLATSVRDHAAAVAILAPGKPVLSYAGLGRRLRAIASGLADAGFGRTARVGVALPDGPEFAVALLGVCSTATCAPLNEALDESALVHLVVALRLDALIVSADTNAAVLRAAHRAGVPLLTLRLASGQDGDSTLEPIHSPLRRRVEAEPPQLDDIALLMHTSGTTGTPKIVPWLQWRVAEAARNRVELARIDRSDRCLILLPLHSSAGIRRLLAGVLTGGSNIVPARLNTDEIIDLLQTLAPTQLFAPPAAHIGLLEAYERRVPRPKHFLRAIWSGTTELPEAVRARLARAFAVPVIVGYGMTESGAIAQTPFPPEQAPPGSAGRAVNFEIAIADESGHFLGPDESGEIVVRGPELFDGYENDAEANRAAFRDGWFRTGDAGHIDREGFIYLAGRLKELINRGGAKVAPAEVEAALMQHPRVIEAAAFAIAHPTLGQDVAAAVVLRGSLGEGEMRRFLHARLAPFKIPTRIFEVANLPRGSTGKFDRAALAGLAERSSGAPFEPPSDREESALARIFSDVLEAPSVGRKDNFFHLGGDSLRGMRVLAAVEADFGIALTLDVLLDHPTVAELAAGIRKRVHAESEHTATPTDPPRSAAALAQVQIDGAR